MRNETSYYREIDEDYSPFVIPVAGFGSILSHSFAQQFVHMSSQVGFVMEAEKSDANPVWGDFNSDGVLDLIVPCHGLSLSHRPFAYLRNVNGTFTAMGTG